MHSLAGSFWAVSHFICLSRTLEVNICHILDNYSKGILRDLQILVGDFLSDYTWRFLVDVVEYEIPQSSKTAAK